MILSRFTRVGETVDAATPGQASLWALTSEQFDHFKAVGFVGIDAATVGSGSDQATGAASQSYGPAAGDLRALNSSLFVQLGSAISTAADMTFDEIRMGDSFDAVTPAVPEPTTAALTLVGALGLGRFPRGSADGGREGPLATRRSHPSVADALTAAYRQRNRRSREP